MDPILIFIVIAVAGLLFMSNRTKKQQRAASEFRNHLAPGDEVMTHSGLLGTVVDVEDDVITLESTPGSRSRWIRAAISKKIEPPVDEVEDESEEDDDEIEDAETDARLIESTDDDVIDVPDDLSSLPPARKDGDADSK
ncbi:preprotein translocase subunit YajC [Cellulomonas sp. URHE0023]|uniref:preprotein translocase subunit YajC n=1 Tax=Cellulomonas sp. URHE0023 TaxID=1380354 RepID=UPI000487A030|nr:preprotein translocase subunit YajC [Cellulomonas sp. URHE0023]